MSTPYPHIHPLYKKQLPYWTKWRDATVGEDAVKEKGETYLPKLFGQERDDYQSYLDGAVYYGATGKTVDALSSAHLRQPPTLNLPKLEGLKENACRDQSMEEVLQTAARELWTVGRMGLLGEFNEEAEPQLYAYDAEAVVNWRIVDDDLQFVIVCESYEKPVKDSPYLWEAAKQYRILELVEGKYVQRVQREIDIEGKTEWRDVEGMTVMPKRPGGEALDFIPFVFLNFEADGVDIGGSPIVDLVNINLKHYRGYADLEQTIHLTACPFLHIDGMPEQDRPKRMPVGASLVLYTMDNAQVKYVTLSGDSIPAQRESLKLKEDQMARMGGSFLRAQKKETETEESLRIQQSGESAVLTRVRLVLNKGFTTICRLLARWLGQPEDPISVVTSDEFFDVVVSLPEADFLLKLYQGGTIGLKEFLEGLQGGGLIKKEWLPVLLAKQPPSPNPQPAPQPPMPPEPPEPPTPPVPGAHP